MNKITVDPKIRFGKPTIRDTRVAVVDVINLIAAGYGIDEIPAQFEGITRDDVIAAVEFAAQLVEEPTRVVIGVTN